jgi:hypothetical protein
VHVSTHSRLSTFTKQPPTEQTLSSCLSHYEMNVADIMLKTVVAKDSNLRWLTGYLSICIIFLSVFSSISVYDTKIRLGRLIKLHVGCGESSHMASKFEGINSDTVTQYALAFHR